MIFMDIAHAHDSNQKLPVDELSMLSILIIK